MATTGNNAAGGLGSEPVASTGPAAPLAPVLSVDGEVVLASADVSRGEVNSALVCEMVGLADSASADGIETLMQRLEQAGHLRQTDAGVQGGSVKEQ